MKRTNQLWAALLVMGCVEQPPEEEIRVAREALTGPTCVTIQRDRLGAVADATIKRTALLKNFGAQPSLRISAREEALLRFELGAIPASASITSATLKLYVNGEAGDGATEIHRVLAPWNESTVTFASFAQKFVAAPLAAFRTPSKTALKSIDLTPQVVRWLHGEPNYGILLDPGPDHHPRCDRDDDDDRDPTLLVSSEATAATRRPALEICYSLPQDHCSTQPCRNGGTCVNDPGGFTCSCPAGFTGPTCATPADDCSPDPCVHGTCASGASGPTCTCPVGYTGSHCEIDVDECAAKPCRNGGVCTDGAAAFTCACPPGFDGSTCEHAIDSCAPAPCHNGGACTNLAGSYTCACATGYAGPTCDVNVDDCMPNVCKNSGTCVDGIASYTCSCAPDWGGLHCETNLNSCAQHPCLNGGACTNTPGSYLCACAPGYTGSNCEIDVDDCASKPCPTETICVDAVNAYTCACPSGYSGATCDTPISLTTSTTILEVAATVTLTVTLPDPAQPGGTIVFISVTPQSASCPSLVVVPEGQTAAVFDCTGTASLGPTVIISATLGAATASVLLTDPNGCPAGRLECGGLCADPQTDPRNCSGCGVGCPTNGICSAGTCACPTDSPSLCGSSCTSLQTDPRNCGGCGVACPMNGICSGGTCACPAGSPSQCGSSCTSFQTDPRNCGACGIVCGSQTPHCNAGVCSGPPVAIPVGTVLQFTLGLSSPAPPEGVQALIAVSPISAASCPAAVTFAPGTTSVTFQCVTTSPDAASGVLSATLGSSVVTIPLGG